MIDYLILLMICAAAWGTGWGLGKVMHRLK